jgi:RNA polymerase sigma factor (sigma-70 family)
MTTMEFSRQLINMKPNMERFAYRLTYNKDDAMDLMQDTYLKALTSKDKFAEFTNLRAWVYTIMKNTFINNYRKSVRENTAFDNSASLYLLNNFVESHLERPDSAIAYKEVRKEVDALDDDLKKPLMMFTEGFKYREIADELNLKIGTVKNRIFLARRKLMESLRDYQYVDYGHSN